ncbi:hypothetical protein QBZ16_004876 [Prototheca wickerhamii]|uniref:Uncharacterized protein n=1 Tax=Prototheca wickerhamii TaxID=3111 RepID=A0AAD9IJC7_PROWI|nr:hypothetical protein QBZ16_004876 [Prototheca wickerhamii]
MVAQLASELGDARRASAVEAFEALGVCKQLAEAAASLGWQSPSEIQAQSIPIVLKGQDVIGLAQTGSGKTGAFTLPILQDLLANPQHFFALVLSPTRELAIQIAEQVEALGSGIGVKTAALVGGIDMMSQAIQLAKRPHVIVGTPGRVADRLLNMDFEKEIDTVVKAIPRERRTQLFSATMTSKVAKLQRACLRNPARVEAAAKNSTVDTLRQEYLFVPAKYKECYLVFLLTDLASTSAIVFARTCDAVRRTALLLRNLGFGAVPIHGQMSQSKRLAAMAKFKTGERTILVATDVASRGLDIPSVDLVDYVHRVGRTARAGRSGRAVTLVTQYDVELYQKVEQVIGKKLEAHPAEQDAVLVMLERVGEAGRLAAMQMKDADAKKRGRGGKGKGDLDADDADELEGLKRGGKRPAAKRR